MAYVPKYSCDVFLSYAHVDNPNTAPWVDAFKQELETALRQELPICCGERRLQVWQDIERLKPGFSLSQEIRKALGRTAAVISLYSPGYLASAYCAEERAAFEGHCGSEIKCETFSRLINVIIRSDPTVQRRASGECLYANFWGAEGPLAIGSQPFRKELNKLVQALKTLLESMRKKVPKVYVSLPRAGGDAESNHYISKKTEELLEELSQSGYARTTEFQPHFYTDAELDEEIREAVLSVHLVADPSDPLNRRQIEAALRARVPMQVWLAESARANIADWIADKVPGKNREYSVEAFPVFCDRVKEVLKKLSNAQALPPVSEPAKRVFVLRDVHKDREATDSLERRLKARNLNVTFQNKNQDWDAFEGVLVYQKGATVDWFTKKLEMVKNAPVVRAACPVSPPDKSGARQVADDFLFKTPSEVDPKDPRMLLEGDNHDHLRPFVDAVLGAGQATMRSSQERTGRPAAGWAIAPEPPPI